MGTPKLCTHSKWTIREVQNRGDTNDLSVLFARRLDVKDLNLTSALYLNKDEFMFLYDHLQGLKWVYSQPPATLEDNIFNPNVQWPCYAGADAYGIQSECVKPNYLRPSADC